MMKINTAGCIAGFALAASALTSCVVVERAPKDAPTRPSPATSAPGHTTSPDPASRPDREFSAPTGSASPQSRIIDLAPEEGTVYIAANRGAGLLSPPKVVGPWLTYWLVDGERITYREVICTGRAVTEAAGRVADDKVLWDDVDPWIGDAESETSSMKRTDTTIRVGFTETATNDVAGEKEKFIGLCTNAGEDVADFLLK